MGLLIKRRQAAGAPDMLMTARDSDLTTRTQQRLAAVKDRFAKGLDDRLANLSSLARAAAGPRLPEAAAACESLRLGLHNLTGSAPTIGFDALGQRARVLESRVIAARGSKGRLSQDDAEAFAQEITDLGALRD